MSAASLLVATNAARAASAAKPLGVALCGLGSLSTEQIAPVYGMADGGWRPFLRIRALTALGHPVRQGGSKQCTMANCKQFVSLADAQYCLG